MRITPTTLQYHELVGLEARISKSSDPTLRDIHGIIVDETKNTLRLMVRDRVMTIPKACSTFIFTLPDGARVRIHGHILVGRPEDRLAKIR